MSAIEQFTYTASPWGKSDPGWMTFQKSHGIEDTEIGELSSYYRYGRPDGWDGAPEPDTLASYPVQFVFARPAVLGGDALLVQTTFTGQRWYDPRPGDWFVHGFRIASSVVDAEKNSAESLLRLFKSDSIQREYPQELREKATLISQKKMQWEAPPDLSSLNSLGDLEQNSDFSLDAVLGRMPDGAWPKLGGLLEACVKRGDSAKAFVFDATKSESLDTMAALLALMPSNKRSEAQFSTYFHAENAREIKADDTFLFYGTVLEDKSADDDTGLYGELPQGGPDFQSSADVELFKQMVDAGGAKLTDKDFDNLVFCWKVASEREKTVESLQFAVAVAKQIDERIDNDDSYPLTSVIAKHLEDKSSDPILIVVAWFEEGLGIFNDKADKVCSDCIGDSSLFTKALGKLTDSNDRIEFANAVAVKANDHRSRVALASMWINDECGIQSLLNPLGDGDFANLAKCANSFALIRHKLTDDDRFEELRRSVTGKEVATWHAELNKVVKTIGIGLKNFSETKYRLDYLETLADVDGVDKLTSFAEFIHDNDEDVQRWGREDVFCRVPPEDLSEIDLVEALEAYEKIGVGKSDVLKRVRDKGRQAGFQEGRNDGISSTTEEMQKQFDAAKGMWETKADELQRELDKAKAHRGLGVWIVLAIAAAALMLGFAGGYVFNGLLDLDEGFDDSLREPTTRSHHVESEPDNDIKSESDDNLVETVRTVKPETWRPPQPAKQAISVKVQSPAQFAEQRTGPENAQARGQSAAQSTALHGQSSAPQKQPTAPQEQSAAPQEQSAAPQEQSAAPQEQSAAPQKQLTVLQQQSAMSQEQPKQLAEPRREEPETKVREVHLPSRQVAPKVEKPNPATLPNLEDSQEQRQLPQAQPAPRQVEQSTRPSALLNPPGRQVPNEENSQPDKGVEKFRKGAGKEK